MATIYRKTDKGQTEIETRLFRLLPRLRTALILVDGHRNDVELAKLIPGDPAVSLQTLLDDGFIEAIAVVEQRPALRATEPSPPRAASAPAPAFEQRRREALRALNDQLGPSAETLALRMEKCSDWNQLMPVLQTAQQLLQTARGAAVAADFGSRFIDTPLG
ncbi:MAG: hypothetical protein AD742_14820 [Methylibium sp. NZG]|nr:MAG: hypothetical protein AD742_14820 [Methylibium sp. NZG]